MITDFTLSDDNTRATFGCGCAYAQTEHGGSLVTCEGHQSREWLSSRRAMLKAAKRAMTKARMEGSDHA